MKGAGGEARGELGKAGEALPLACHCPDALSKQLTPQPRSPTLRAGTQPLPAAIQGARIQNRALLGLRPCDAGSQAVPTTSTQTSDHVAERAEPDLQHCLHPTAPAGPCCSGAPCAQSPAHQLPLIHSLLSVFKSSKSDSAFKDGQTMHKSRWAEAEPGAGHPTVKVSQQTPPGTVASQWGQEKGCFVLGTSLEAAPPIQGWP